MLALGIGVNAALYTGVRSFTTRPAPGIARNDALVRIRGTVRHGETGMLLSRSFAAAEVAELRHSDVFRGIAAWATENVSLDFESEESAVAASASYVTKEYFATLGVGAVLGTTSPISTATARSADAIPALISHDLWIVLGGAGDILSRPMRVNGNIVTIVGVAPPRFLGPNSPASRRTVWLPLSARPFLGRGGTDSSDLSLVARLDERVSLQQATAVARSIATRITPQAGRDRQAAAWSADVVPLFAGNDMLSSEGQGTAMAVLSTIALMILLIVGTTVSSLLLASGIARRQEIGVRLSLGASRSRVVRQLLTESTLLAVVGGSAGLAVYWGLIKAFDARLPELHLRPDLATLLITLALSIATGVVFGLSPALHATRIGLAELLKGASGGATVRAALQRRLIVAQIALTQPLLLGLGALISLAIHDGLGTSRSPFGANILALHVSSEGDAAKRGEMQRDLERVALRLKELPAVLNTVPHTDAYVLSDFEVHASDRSGEAGAPSKLRVHAHYAAPGYFALMAIPVLRGRDFQHDDRDAVIIGSDLARSLWGPKDPIGRRFRASWRGRGDSTTRVVVGVIDATQAGQSFEGGSLPGMRVFVPMGSSRRGGLLMTGPRSSVTGLRIRTIGSADRMIPVIRRLVRTEFPQIPLESVATLKAIERDASSERVRITSIAAASGLLTLLLASIGLYAVIALAVGQQTREIGIRLALGARAQVIVRTFVVSGIRLTLTGLVLGLPLSVLALRTVGADIQMSKTLLAFAIAGVVTAVATFATWLPARGAARVDPLVALRAP